MATERIDVLAVMDAAEDDLSALGYSANETIKQLRKARAAVAEAIEAVTDVYGDACDWPHGACDGPCPSCRIKAALARVGGA